MPEKQLSLLDGPKKSEIVMTSKSDSSRLLLQLLSVIYEPVAITSLMNCAKELGIKQENGNQHSVKTLKPLLSQLIKKGVVEEENNKYFCTPSVVEKISREAVDDSLFRELSIIVQNKISLQNSWHGVRPSSWEQAIRELRIALYLNREDHVLRELERCEVEYPYEFYHCNPFFNICFKPFDADWFSALPAAIADVAIFSAFNEAMLNLEDISELNEWLLKLHEEKTFQLPSRIIYIISSLLLLKGDLKKVKSLLPSLDGYHQSMLQGWMLFLERDDDGAIQYYTDALQKLRKSTKKRKIFIDSIGGLFFILALLRRGSLSDLQQVKEHIHNVLKSSESSLHTSYIMFSQLLEFLEGKPLSDDYMIRVPVWGAHSSSALVFFLQALGLYWMDKNAAKACHKDLLKCVSELEKNGYQWMAAECYELASQTSKKDAVKHSKNAAKIRKACGFETIIDVIREKEPWERALDAITNISAVTKSETTKKQSRLVWILSFHGSQLSGVLPKEQKKNAKGGWSSGRQVGLKRLSEDQGSFDCLTEHDIQASKAIVHSRDYWGAEYEIEWERLLTALVGHPYLFSSDKNGTHLELVKGSPEIQVIKKGQNLIIKMTPEFDEDASVSLVKESEARWKVIEPTPEQRHLSSLIGDGLKIPKEAKDKVLASMSAVAPFVDIHSDIGGGMSEAESVEADNTIHMLLSPLEEGLKIEARMQLFGSKGPYYHPGAGGQTIIAEVDGKRLQATRDLKLEQKNVQTIMNECPELSNIEMSNNEWAVFDPETCLEILVELKAQENAIISWPEGEKLKVNQTVSLSDLKMVIKKENDWFSAGGELKLDDGQVLNMKRLMELSKGAKGRFISLADGQYLALTDTFKSRIAELQAFGDEKDDEIILHPLAAIALDDIASEVGKLTSDKGWKTYISRFHEAMKLEPEIPSTLQAELRDYQKEGFQWLVRLAHWGVGACLADDMGLGKTVQSIALLLYRANKGAALIVAPTSVAVNWMDEIERFAPTLNIIDYRESDRDEVLTNLQPFDVVICSYGLLQNNIEQIVDVDWATVALDEAQAIKNSATKRSKAVMRLKSDVKVVMTGTPIENHLGELWNLFRFINPGLLGSMEKFNDRYANPIVRDESVDVRHKLKKLIQPYILRRTKTQVLKELPPRTEIALGVEMSKDEAALYEALRREAFDKFAQADLPQGNRQLQILAEITRLRRACCNPALVLKAGAPTSSKLALFTNVVEELLDNNHKALVFSQFVDHLTIIREKLDSLGIEYQYLDGSTSAKERKKRVAAFQSGVGDLFLISLKAGGVGLNLTAADYVIHMDPWWNPAVEDQASDRAHRIGQKRPVTVYRMITKNTIEEKIVALHQGKRDLADNLLAGSDVAGKVDVEELLNLLKES